ncbi:MAG: hypothetical protein ACYCTF_12910 [Acidiferrobacter sp.]
MNDALARIENRDGRRERDDQHPGPLAGHIALVIGGAQGLGAAICRNLSQAGAAVIAGDFLEDEEDRPLEIKATAVFSGDLRTPSLLDRFPEIDQTTLRDLANVAHTVRLVLTQPAETVIPEIMARPMRETSWF